MVLLAGICYPEGYLSALIFLRRAKRKLVERVDLVTLAIYQWVDQTNGDLGVDSREESFGQMARLGQARGVI